MHSLTLHSLQDDLVVDFNYIPEERQTWDHPGCPAYVEILAATIRGVDVSELISSLNGWGRIEELVMEDFEASYDWHDDIREAS